MSTAGQSEGAAGGRVCGLRRQWRAGDLGPDLERLGAGLPIVGDGAVVATEMEQVGDRIMNGEETLDLAGVFEALSLPFASAGGLVGVLGPVVQTLVLAMLPAHSQFPLGSGIGLQLVGGQHAGHPALLLQQLAQQTLGRLGIPAALNQHGVTP